MKYRVHLTVTTEYFYYFEATSEEHAIEIAEAEWGDGVNGEVFDEEIVSAVATEVP